jgi:hypothetical protein
VQNTGGAGMSVFDRDDEREYKDISDYSTSQLIAELATRDGVIVPHPDLWFGIINNEIKCGKSPKILVVRE